MGLEPLPSGMCTYVHLLGHTALEGLGWDPKASSMAALQLHPIPVPPTGIAPSPWCISSFLFYFHSLADLFSGSHLGSLVLPPAQPSPCLASSLLTSIFSSCWRCSLPIQLVIKDLLPVMLGYSLGSQQGHKLGRTQMASLWPLGVISSVAGQLW